ncbi:hypothetical protein PHMEG_00023271 [Phytophthora megakarya]|uniref:Uncharacterized protein n=1 Tax=Phytophthora megakarya TaxID=4795 RepID=A0A225VHH2_9STRA|nr:hypothetical protein PHMEG_00023271 [Phytophthora megakarya]
MSNASNVPNPSGSSSGGSSGSAFDPHSTREELHRYATRLFRHQLDDLRDYIQEQDRGISFIQQSINGQIVDLESQVTQLLQEREHAGAEILDLQEQRDTADRARDQATDQLPVTEGVLRHTCLALDRIAEGVELQDRFDQIQKGTEEIKRKKSRCELLCVNLAGAVMREKGYRDESEDLNHDVAVARTAYANAERSVTEQKAKILALNRQLANQLLEKDDGGGSPLPTPGPRYLTYEKGGSKKPDVPAGSDPASKSTPKSKSRSKPEGDNDEVLADMLQAQTLVALSRPDPSNDAAIMLLPVAPVPVPVEMKILDRGWDDSDDATRAMTVVAVQTRQYNIADVDPWVIQRINTLTIKTMTLEVLSRALPFRPEWIFPDHVHRAATPRPGQYCSHLITGQNVRDLMAALPGTSSLEPTFPSRWPLKSRSTVA